MSFSATDAAFEGFRVVRRQPLVLVWWSLFYLACFALMFLLAFAPLVGVMTAMEDMQAMGSTFDPAAFDRLNAAGLALMPLVLPLGLLTGAMLSAAIVRSVISPEKSAFGYLRLGMDELRVVVVTLVLGILTWLASIAAFGLVGVLVGFLASMDVPGIFLIGAVLFLGAVVLVIWLTARLSLAVPITVAEKKFAIFESFGLTAGRVLGIIGMAVIALVMTLVVSLLAMVVFFPVTMGLGMGVDWTALADAGPFAAMQSVGHILLITALLNAISSALTAAVWAAPFSAAYRDIRASRPA